MHSAALSALLLDSLRAAGPGVVALSGGVDSAVVARAAFEVWRPQALAVTGVSPSLAAGELEAARRVAEFIGIRHETVETREFASPAYRENAPDRCFHCKTELYSQLAARLAEWGVTRVYSGTNADDLSDFRPGLAAAAHFEVRAPLAECGLGKAAVRALAAHWQLPVAEKPASPCLASRVAYGEEVNEARMAMIDRAEQYLRKLGIAPARVRYHRGDHARLEVPPAAIAHLAEPDVRGALVGYLKSLGFKFVSLDLEGFRSGGFQVLVPAEVLRGE